MEVTWDWNCQKCNSKLILSLPSALKWQMKRNFSAILRCSFFTQNLGAAVNVAKLMSDSPIKAFLRFVYSIRHNRR